MDGRGKTRRVAIACQGGGSHTAFTAGTLKKMLEEGHERYDFVAFSGTSGGAVCALLAWYALIEHSKGEAGAREAGHLLDKFWVEDNAAKDPPGEAAQRLAHRVVALAEDDRPPRRR